MSYQRDKQIFSVLMTAAVLGMVVTLVLVAKRDQLRRIVTVTYSGEQSMEAGMKIRPLSDRILVKREDAEQKTATGIVIPDIAQEKPTKATVKAVGPGRVTSDGRLIEMNVKVGDTVLFGKYSGNEIEVDGEKLLMMREEDILGVVEK